MDKYFNLYQEMLSLCGFSDHILKSYCTYICSMLFINNQKIFHDRNFVNISYGYSRNAIWLTIQLIALFHSLVFLMYVLHNPWDDI